MALGSGYTAQGPGHLEKLARLTLGLSIEVYMFSLFLGLPIVVALYKLRRLTIINLLLSALVAGAIAGAGFGIVIYWPSIEEISGTYLIFGSIGGGAGLLVSSVFCLLSGVLRGALKRRAG